MGMHDFECLLLISTYTSESKWSIVTDQSHPKKKNPADAIVSRLCCEPNEIS